MATLPPLATVEDLAAEVGQTIASNDKRALRALAGASARVRSYTGRTWVDSTGELTDVPDEVVTVTLQVAARKWQNPQGMVQETSGPFSVRRSERAGEGLYLTDDEKAMLADYREGPGGLWSLGTTRNDPFLDCVLHDLRKARWGDDLDGWGD